MMARSLGLNFDGESPRLRTDESRRGERGSSERPKPNRPNGSRTTAKIRKASDFFKTLFFFVAFHAGKQVRGPCLGRFTVLA